MILNFNSTSAQIDGSMKYFSYLFTIIILINIISIIYYFFNIFIDFRIKYFETNFQKIHQFLYVTCPISSIILSLNKILILIDLISTRPLIIQIFTILYHIRIATIFPGLTCLAALVIERFFATFYLKDYEKNPRKWFGYLIGIGLYIFSVFLSVTLTYAKTPLYHLTFIFLLNTISFLGNIIYYKLNRHYYKKCQQSFNGKYSLGERYQISQNIHCYYFFNCFSTSIAAFTILSSTFILLSYLSVDIFYRNLSITMFELIFSLYTIVTPYIIYKCNNRRNHEIRLIFKKLIMKMTSNKINSSTSTTSQTKNIKLKNSFGREMNIQLQKQSDVYFMQLEQIWKTELSRKYI